jgi:hypothetical protein
MRCICCDKNLREHESVRRHAITNEFLDLCDGCLREIPGLPTKLPTGVVIESDPFEDSETNDVDIESVTDCYTLDLDKD